MRKELSRQQEMYEQEAAEWNRKCTAIEIEYQEEMRKKEREIRIKEDDYEERVCSILLIIRF